jgi:hypothetical protein
MINYDKLEELFDQTFLGMGRTTTKAMEPGSIEIQTSTNDISLGDGYAENEDYFFSVLSFDGGGNNYQLIRFDKRKGTVKGFSLESAYSGFRAAGLGFPTLIGCEGDTVFFSGYDYGGFPHDTTYPLSVKVGVMSVNGNGVHSIKSSGNMGSVVEALIPANVDGIPLAEMSRGIWSTNDDAGMTIGAKYFNTRNQVNKAAYIDVGCSINGGVHQIDSGKRDTVPTNATNNGWQDEWGGFWVGSERSPVTIKSYPRQIHSGSDIRETSKILIYNRGSMASSQIMRNDAADSVWFPKTTERRSISSARDEASFGRAVAFQIPLYNTVAGAEPATYITKGGGGDLLISSFDRNGLSGDYLGVFAVDSSGNLYTAWKDSGSAGNIYLRKFSPSGTMMWDVTHAKNTVLGYYLDIYFGKARMSPRFIKNQSKLIFSMDGGGVFSTYYMLYQYLELDGATGKFKAPPHDASVLEKPSGNRPSTYLYPKVNNHNAKLGISLVCLTDYDEASNTGSNWGYKFFLLDTYLKGASSAGTASGTLMPYERLDVSNGFLFKVTGRDVLGKPVPPAIYWNATFYKDGIPQSSGMGSTVEIGFDKPFTLRVTARRPGYQSIDETIRVTDPGEMFLTLGPLDLSKQKTYYVSNPAELIAVRDDPEGKYIQTKDIDMSGVYYETPFMTKSYNPFVGSYNGQGFKIKNLTINSSDFSVYGDGYGLFGTTLNAQLGNIILEDVTVWGHTRSSALAGVFQFELVSTDPSQSPLPFINNCRISNAAMHLSEYSGHAGAYIGHLTSTETTKAIAIPDTYHMFSDLVASGVTFDNPGSGEHIGGFLGRMDWGNQ